MNALEAVKMIQEKAKELNKQDVRIINDKTVPIGRVFRQGDIYLFRVPLTHPVGEEVNIRQLVDGVSVGARHILRGNVKVYEGKEHPLGVDNKYPLGYAFDVDDAVLEHPEHAHGEICHKTTARYQVIHQIDMLTMRMVSD